MFSQACVKNSVHKRDGPLQRTVRILLECILVFIFLLTNGKTKFFDYLAMYTEITFDVCLDVN